MKMRIRAAVVSFLLVLAATAGAVTFDVRNDASGTAGGQRFDREYGADYAKQVLSDASEFTWSIFNEPSPADRNSYQTVLLEVVDSLNAVAQTIGNTIQLSAASVNGITGDNLRTQVDGVLYHEVVHVWQSGLQDYQGHSWVFEGIADFVRLRAGLAAGNWMGRGGGNSWEEGYGVTAFFLDCCESLRQGFVAELNNKLRDGYSDDYFVQLLGKSVQQLWQDYKAQYPPSQG